jgi:hypothetical protein
MELVGLIETNFKPDGWSDPAHEELTPMPMVNNAMARAYASLLKAFAIAELLHILIFPPQIRC